MSRGDEGWCVVLKNELLAPSTLPVPGPRVEGEANIKHRLL